MLDKAKSVSGGEKYAAVILAAGKGTRMNEGSASPIPKVMFEIAGKPIIDWSVKLIHDAGINKVVLVVGYKKEMIDDYFGDKVEYAVQEEQLGTGHAAAQAKSVLDGKAESLIIFYGDNCLYRPESVKKLIEIYEREKPMVAMLTVLSDKLNDWAFGRIARNENNDVVGIVEQKDCTEEQLKINEGNPGFYIFNAPWFWGNISRINTDNAQKELYLTDIIAIAKGQNKKIVALPVLSEEEALGINNPEQKKQAEEILLARS